MIAVACAFGGALTADPEHGRFIGLLIDCLELAGNCRGDPCRVIFGGHGEVEPSDPWLLAIQAMVR